MYTLGALAQLLGVPVEDVVAQAASLTNKFHVGASDSDNEHTRITHAGAETIATALAKTL